jgi:pimeloyl-ACP methyl ester carboxylesterase
MKSILTILLLCLSVGGVLAITPEPEGVEDLASAEQHRVVLLHGLARTSASMNRMERELNEAGFETCNISYPSRRHTIETLATEHVLPQIEECLGVGEMPIDFVTHSMGGLIVRYLAETELADRMGRVVMLSPPNGGSQIVDKLGDWWLFEVVNGPAGSEMGTDSESLPRQLGPPDYEVGVIAGTRSINLILSALIEGEDDGKVSVENARLEGMTDFLVMPASHTFIMRKRRAIEQAIHFLENGAFLEG